IWVKRVSITVDIRILLATAW
ncbi:hypothetical protein MGSAQ_003123, partial [marine sediment metagenome]